MVKVERRSPAVMACAPKQRMRSEVVRLMIAYWGVRQRAVTEEGWMRHLRMIN